MATENEEGLVNDFMEWLLKKVPDNEQPELEDICECEDCKDLNKGKDSYP